MKDQGYLLSWPDLVEQFDENIYRVGRDLRLHTGPIARDEGYHLGLSVCLNLPVDLFPGRVIHESQCTIEIACLAGGH
jgi:hypothetical protein